MKTIGITGGIGSGKSMVCKVFSTLGYRIYDADVQAKQLIHDSLKLRTQIIAVFGEEAYLSGVYNRPFIASKVFQHPELLQALNEIVHPATRQNFLEWIAETPESYPRKAVIKEAAILFESGAYKDVDFVISVYAPKSTRIQRVIQRDNIPVEAVLKRMNNQWTERKKIQKADAIIYNDGHHALIPQVLELHAKIENRNGTFFSHH